MNVPRVLRNVLSDQPLLWLGAGASCQADPPLPTLAELVKRLKEKFDWCDEYADPYSAIDRFLADRIGTQGDLREFLDRQIRPGGLSPMPGSLHRSLAELVAAGKISTVVDTNYDLVFRRALDHRRVPYHPAVLHRNLELRTTDGVPRYLSIHGNFEDWSTVVLTGESYAEFEQRHELAHNQVEVWLRQRPIVFVGCSMTDPRLLTWIARQSPADRSSLKRWVAVVGPGDRDALKTAQGSEDKSAFDLLDSVAQFAELPDYDTLPVWFAKLAEIDEGQPATLHGRQPLTVEDTLSPNALIAPLTSPVPFDAAINEAPLRQLTEWARSSSTLLAVLSGSAGAGKSRVALALCDELAAEHGWLAGVASTPEDLSGLRHENRNALIVVDDADRDPDCARWLSALQLSPENRSRKILFVARRSTGKWWEQGVLGQLDVRTASHPFRVDINSMPPNQQALQRLAGSMQAALRRLGVVGTEPGSGVRWGYSSALEAVSSALVTTLSGHQGPHSGEYTRRVLLREELRICREALGNTVRSETDVIVLMAVVFLLGGANRVCLERIVTGFELNVPTDARIRLVQLYSLPDPGEPSGLAPVHGVLGEALLEYVRDEVGNNLLTTLFRVMPGHADLSLAGQWSATLCRTEDDRRDVQDAVLAAGVVGGELENAAVPWFWCDSLSARRWPRADGRWVEHLEFVLRIVEKGSMHGWHICMAMVIYDVVANQCVQHDPVVAKRALEAQDSIAMLPCACHHVRSENLAVVYDLSRLDGVVSRGQLLDAEREFAILRDLPEAQTRRWFRLLAVQGRCIHLANRWRALESSDEFADGWHELAEKAVETARLAKVGPTDFDGDARQVCNVFASDCLVVAMDRLAAEASDPTEALLAIGSLFESLVNSCDEGPAPGDFAQIYRLIFLCLEWPRANRPEWFVASCRRVACGEITPPAWKGREAASSSDLRFLAMLIALQEAESEEDFIFLDHQLQEFAEEHPEPASSAWVRGYQRALALHAPRRAGAFVVQLLRSADEPASRAAWTAAALQFADGKADTMRILDAGRALRALRLRLAARLAESKLPLEAFALVEHELESADVEPAVWDEMRQSVLEHWLIVEKWSRAREVLDQLTSSAPWSQVALVDIKTGHAQEVLERARHALRCGTGDAPAPRAVLLSMLKVAALHVDDPCALRDAALGRLKLARREPGPRSEEAVDAQSDLARALLMLDDRSGAIALLKGVVEVVTRDWNDPTRSLVERARLARWYLADQQAERAAALADEAARDLERLPPDALLLEARHTIACVRAGLGRDEAAERMLDALVSDSKRLLGRGDAATINYLDTLAVVCWGLGRRDDAEGLLWAAEQWIARFGVDGEIVATIATSKGLLEAEQGRYIDASQSLRAAVGCCGRLERRATQALLDLVLDENAALVLPASELATLSDLLAEQVGEHCPVVRRLRSARPGTPFRVFAAADTAE